MVRMKLQGRVWVASGQLQPGEPELIDLPVDGDVSVSVDPGAGGGFLVEFTVAPKDDILAEDALWFQWEPGNVAAATNDTLQGPKTCLRLTATVSAGFYEVCQRRQTP